MREDAQCGFAAKRTHETAGETLGELIFCRLPFLKHPLRPFSGGTQLWEWLISAQINPGLLRLPMWCVLTWEHRRSVSNVRGERSGPSAGRLLHLLALRTQHLMK